MDSIGLYVLLLIVLVFLSAFFSSAETAFSTLNLLRIKKLSEDGNVKAKKAEVIAQNFEITISTILVCNNLVNIGLASITTIYFLIFFPEISSNLNAALSTIFVTIIVLILGEILPKSYSKNHPEKMALMISTTMLIIIKVLKPFIYPLYMLSNLMSKKQQDHISVTEDELRAMIDYIEEEGVIEEDESDLIRSALDFDDKTCGEVLTPRTDVRGLDVRMHQDEILAIIFEEKYSRYPVYEDSIDNIIGIVHERDIFTCAVKNHEFNLKAIIKEATFIPKSMKMSKLLAQLQATNAHMAIVKDEHGGTAGICTMEDLLEQLVGEIWDEHDEVIEKIKEINGNLVVSDDFELAELFEDYLENEKIPDTEYSTVGGWVYQLIEEIPVVNSKYLYRGEYYEIEITILEIENYSIDKLELKITPLEQDEEKVIRI